MFSSKIVSIAGSIAATAMVCLIPLKADAMEENLKSFTLSNGLEVIVKEDHARKVATLQLWVLVGSADEQRSEGGISHLIEHMAFKGTKRRGVGEISREVEALGGDTNAYTGWDETVFHITVPSSATLAGLDILTDAVLRPSIDPGELEKEKQVVLEEILEGDERPDRKAGKLLFKTAYKQSPYQYPVIGYKEVVEKFTRDNILAFRKKWYVPENMFLLVVGDVNPDQIRTALEPMVADFHPVGLCRPPRPMEQPQTEIRSALEKDPNAQETRFHIAFHIPSVKANDVNALDLTGDILGARDSSRLVRVLKKEKKLVNSISASAYTPKDPGLFVIGGTAEAKNLPAVTQAVVQELSRLAEEPPSAEELERAKVHVESQYVYADETVGGKARNIGNFRADLGDPNYEAKYLTLNSTIKPADISTVVSRYLVSPNISISVLVPEREADSFQMDTLTKTLSELGKKRAEKKAQTATAEKAKEYKLPNGIRVVIRPDDSNPTVSARIAMLGGKRFETKETEGIMSLIAQMLDKGTSKMSEVEISRKVEDIGGRLSGFSGYDSLGLYGTFFSRNLDEGLQIMAQLYTDPAFPQDKLERERMLTINRIKTLPDRPVQYTIKTLNETLYQHHPYGFDKDGTLATVAGFTTGDLQDTYRRFAVPSNTVITLVGRLDPDNAFKSIEELFGKIPAKALDAPQIPKEEPVKETRTKIIRIPRAKAHIAIGFLSTSFADADRYALDVLNNILSGMGGRLFRELRDKQSLAYTVTSYDRPGFDPGSFVMYIACDASKVDRAYEGLSQQIKLIREQPPTKEELERSITNLVGNHRIALQSTWSRAEDSALNTLYGLGYNYDQEYLKKIEEVKADDVLRVARKYIDPAHAAVVKILPEEQEKEK